MVNVCIGGVKLQGSAMRLVGQVSTIMLPVPPLASLLVGDKGESTASILPRQYLASALPRLLQCLPVAIHVNRDLVSRGSRSSKGLKDAVCRPTGVCTCPRTHQPPKAMCQKVSLLVAGLGKLKAMEVNPNSKSAIL